MRGIDKISEYLGNYPDNYIIIGGTAYNMIVSASQLRGRATKDVDMIITETINKEFLSSFWNFIKAGGYKVAQKISDEKVIKTFYRFIKPENKDYPEYIELFSRVPDNIDLPESVRIVHIDNNDYLSSFSAIILDDDYYNFSLMHTSIIDGVSIADAYALIVLKAKAYVNNLEAKQNGVSIDQIDIDKHKKDIYRLSFVIDDERNISVPASIKNDLRKFLSLIETAPIATKQISKTINVSEVTQNEFKELIEKVFGL